MINKKKKAQVTIFIILAVLIVGIVIGYIILKKFTNEPGGEDIEVVIHDDYIKEFIFDCIKDTSSESLEIIGIQGGYYNQPDYYKDIGWAFIPIYYNRGIISYPDKNLVENELAAFVDDNLENCLNSFDYENYELTYKSSKTIAQINKDNVKFTTDLPLTLTKNNNRVRFQLKDHTVIINSLLYDILDVSKFITDSHNDNSDLLCINCVTDMANEKDLYVDVFEYGDDKTELVVISENKTGSESYIFEFVNIYS